MMPERFVFMHNGYWSKFNATMAKAIIFFKREGRNRKQGRPAGCLEHQAVIKPEVKEKESGMNEQVQGRSMSFQLDAMFAQDIFLCDFFRHASGHENCLAAKDQDLIGVKDSIAVLIEDDKFIAVFFPDLLSEFSYSGVTPLLFQLFLLNHPVPIGRGQRHDQNGEIGMNHEAGFAVFRRPFYEPGLF